MTYSIDRDIEMYGTTPASTRRWFSRADQSWVVELLDAEGNQIGGAEYVGARGGGRAIAIEIERALREEYGLAS